MGITIYFKHFWLGRVLPVAVLSLFTAAAADAAFFNNSTGLATPSVTIDFSEHTYPDDTVITTEFSDFGVTFTPNLYYQTTFPGGLVPNATAPDLTNFIPGPGSGLVNPFSINFSSPVSGAAFVLGTNPNMTTFTAFLLGVQVDAGIAPTDLNNAMDFYGFKGITFDKITVSVGGDGFAILDTLQIVPEPSSWMLLVAGGIVLVGVTGLRRVIA